MTLYGWFLKHKRTGKLVRIDGDNVTVVDTLVEATRYARECDAQNAKFTALTLPMGKGIEYEVFDATIHDAPTPDANPEVVPTRDELLKAAYEGGAARRAAHDAARKEFAEQPSGIIIPHPGEQPVVKRARAAMKTTRRRK